MVLQPKLQKTLFIYFYFHYPFYIVFQVFKVLPRKIYKLKLLVLLFHFYCFSFYMSRYHLSQIFRTSFNITSKEIFVTNLSFLIDSFNPSPSKRLKSAKHDKRFLLMPPNIELIIKNAFVQLAEIPPIRSIRAF